MSIPNKIIIIGATAKDAGKTTLACQLIERLKSDYDIAALKTSVREDQRSLQLIASFEPGTHSDTAMYLNAGAKKSYFLQTSPLNLHKAFQSFLKNLAPGELIICESTSLIDLITPNVFIMLTNESADCKPTAEKALKKADFIIPFTPENFAPPIDEIIAALEKTK